MSAKELDVSALRLCLGQFATGVVVVTCIDEVGQPRGFTANSFTSVSLQPPLVLFCIAKHAGSHSVFIKSSAFAINILSAKQKRLAEIFASKQINKFSNNDWRAGSGGSPIFDESSAWLDCVTFEKIDAGDHTIVIGRVVACSHREAVPLAYHSGQYRQVGDALQAQFQ